MEHLQCAFLPTEYKKKTELKQLPFWSERCVLMPASLTPFPYQGVEEGYGGGRRSKKTDLGPTFCTLYGIFFYQSE